MADQKEQTPSGVVELIIAVDLDPSDPEEPINVSDVDVRSKGGAEGGAFPDYRDLLVRVLEANDILAGKMSDDELKEAAEQFITGDKMADKIEDDPFAKAQMMGEPPERKPKGMSFKATADKLRGGPMVSDEDEDEEE